MLSRKVDECKPLQTGGRREIPPRHRRQRRRGGGAAAPRGRGLHSSTFQLNLSCFPLTTLSASRKKRLH